MNIFSPKNDVVFALIRMFSKTFCLKLIKKNCQNRKCRKRRLYIEKIRAVIGWKEKTNKRTAFPAIKYQIFHYTGCITPKCVTSMQGPSPRHCAQATQLRSFEEKLQQWRAVGDTVFDLTVPRFEPQTYRSRDEHVTARPIVAIAICN